MSEWVLILNAVERPGQSHFVDTLAQVGGLWSFGSEGMKSISNQYAAMPSLHIG